MRKKYELGSEYGSVHSWKEKIKVRNEKDWEEEVSSKSTLKQYKLAKKWCRGGEGICGRCKVRKL